MTLEEILIREDAEGLQSKLQELIRRKSGDDTVILRIEIDKEIKCESTCVSLSFPNSKEEFFTHLDYEDVFNDSCYLEEIMDTIFESYEHELVSWHKQYKDDERFANLIRNLDTDLIIIQIEDDDIPIDDDIYELSEDDNV